MTEKTPKPAKTRLLAALLDPNNRSLAAAARAADVPERTATRWAADPAFQAELRRQQTSILDQIELRLTGLQDDAVDTLKDSMKLSAFPATALRAAELVLTIPRRWRREREIEDRLQRIEEMLRETS